MTDFYDEFVDKTQKVLRFGDSLSRHSMNDVTYSLVGLIPQPFEYDIL
jgi:hypothetical protein